MTMVEVVEIRAGAPTLNDIPGQLRRMADMIERGEVAGQTAIFVLDDGASKPEAIYLWGIGGSNDRIAILEMAKAMMIAERL
jgi:hypothetical protein